VRRKTTSSVLKIFCGNIAKLLESKWKENPHFIHGGFIDTHIRQVEAELLNEI